MSAKEPAGPIETRPDAEGATPTSPHTIVGYQQIPLRALLPFLLAAERKGETAQVLRTLNSLSRAEPDATVMLPSTLWQGLALALASLGLCTSGLVYHTPSLLIRGTTLTPLPGGDYRLEFKLGTSTSDVSVQPNSAKVLNRTTGTDSGTLTGFGAAAGWTYVDFTPPAGPPAWTTGDPLVVTVGYDAESHAWCTTPSPGSGAVTEPAVVP